MKIDTLERLLVHELKDLYNAEKQFADALPKMAEAASSDELKAAFKNHCEETKVHRQRLEKLFDQGDFAPGGERCEAAEGLVSEGEGIIKEMDAGPIRDAALIGAAQRVEHYELAGYGTAVELAIKLDMPDVAELLRSTLDEEGEANRHLTRVAEQVNTEALAASPLPA